MVFLAPYRVTNSFLNIDLEGWTPEEDELDIKGNLIKAGFYNRKTFGRELVIMQRRDIVARQHN